MMVIDEMAKLREGLDAAGLPWVDKSEYRYGMEFQRTHFVNKHHVACSAIYIPGMSYGWQGELLEVAPPLIRDEDYEDEVQGWLTAEEILAEWAQLASADSRPAQMWRFYELIDFLLNYVIM